MTTKAINIDKHPLDYESLNVRSGQNKGAAQTGFCCVRRGGASQIRVGRMTEPTARVVFPPSKYTEADPPNKMTMTLAIDADTARHFDRLQERAVALIAGSAALTYGKSVDAAAVAAGFGKIVHRDDERGECTVKLKVNGSGQGRLALEVYRYYADSHKYELVPDGVQTLVRGDRVMFICEPQYCWAKGQTAYGVAIACVRVYVHRASAALDGSASNGDLSDADEDVECVSDEPPCKRARLAAPEAAPDQPRSTLATLLGGVDEQN